LEINSKKLVQDGNELIKSKCLLLQYLKFRSSEFLSHLFNQRYKSKSNKNSYTIQYNTMQICIEPSVASKSEDYNRESPNQS